MQVISNTDVIAEVTLGNFADGQKASLNFPCGDLTFTPFVRLASTGDGASIRVDNIYNGEARNVGYTNLGKQPFGSITWAPTANCAWSKGVDSYANFASDNDCDDNARTVTGSVTDVTAGLRPAFGVSSMQAGHYEVFLEGTQEVYYLTTGVQATSLLRLFDGTSQYGISNTLAVGGATGSVVNVVGGIRFSFDLSNSIGATTFDFQTKNVLGNFYLDATTTGLKISVYYTPNQTATTIASNSSPRSWSGGHDSSCAWNYTNSANYVLPTGDATCGFTTTKDKNFWAVSSAVDGTGKLPKISFTPTQTGSLHICATQLAISNANANKGVYTYLTDNEAVLNSLGDLQVFQTDAVTSQSMGTWCFNDVITNTNLKTYSFMTAVGSSSTGQVLGINWNLTFIPDLMMPALTGSVATYNNGKSYNNVCTKITNNGSTCISSESWITSGSWISTGRCDLTVLTNLFKTGIEPMCTFGQLGDTKHTNLSGTPSASSIKTITQITNTGGGADAAYYLCCFGERGSL